MIKMHSKAILKIQNVICCSNSLQNIYKDLFQKKFQVIKNGIDCKKYDFCSEKEKEILKKKNHLDKYKKIFLVVGGLNERKDPLTIIKAFLGKDLGNEYLLLFLGDGNLKEECKKYQSENIKFSGHVINVAEYLKLADIFISASLSEGLPNAVLEAGASGLPMILSDISQHREIFEDSVPGIEYFKSGDVEDLKEKIEFCLENYNTENQFRIREHIYKNFDSINE